MVCKIRAVGCIGMILMSAFWWNPGPDCTGWPMGGRCLSREIFHGQAFFTRLQVAASRELVGRLATGAERREVGAVGPSPAPRGAIRPAITDFDLSTRLKPSINAEADEPEDVVGADGGADGHDVGVFIGGNNCLRTICRSGGPVE